MKKVNENDFEYRNGDSGPKYMIRGPNIDWGIMLLKPGEKMGPHGHIETEETFYFIQGEGKMVVNDHEHDAIVGDAFLVEAQEKHDIYNTGSEDLKVVFIKTPYKPDDKIKY
ncbi:MAG: cupin domain-containing protein [Candidatus Hodarchaeota archaeon]